MLCKVPDLQRILLQAFRFIFELIQNTCGGGSVPLARGGCDERQAGVDAQAGDCVRVEQVPRQRNTLRVPDPDAAVGSPGHHTIASEPKLDPLVGRHFPLQLVQNLARVPEIPAQDVVVLPSSTVQTTIVFAE